MPDFEIVPASTLGDAGLHAAFTAAFSDYLIGPFTQPLSQWPLFIGRQVISLAHSRIALRQGTVLAFAFIATRPELSSWRLATMGAIPAARGSGATPALLADFIERAAQAGMARVELECFEQNERALRLYQRQGFEIVARLHGYSRDAGPIESHAHPAEVALEDAYAWLDSVGRARDDLPLQVTPVSLRALPGLLRAWRVGNAQLVVVEGAETLTVQSLVDTNPAQRDAQQLVAAVVSRYPAHRIAAPQLQRPDVGGEALLRLGFTRLPLNQVLMFRPCRP